MREGTRGSTGKSSELLWETLEQTIRGKVQEFIQEILEEEVTDFLGGRRKSQRKSSVEGDPKGYRNGYGKPRNLTLATPTVVGAGHAYRLLLYITHFLPQPPLDLRTAVSSAMFSPTRRKVFRLTEGGKRMIRKSMVCGLWAVWGLFPVACGTDPGEPLTKDESLMLFDGMTEVFPEIDSTTTPTIMVDCPRGGRTTVSITATDHERGDTAVVEVILKQDPDRCVLETSPVIEVSGDSDVRYIVKMEIAGFFEYFDISGGVMGGVRWKLGDRSGTCAIDLNLEIDTDTEPDDEEIPATYVGKLCGHDVETDVPDDLFGEGASLEGRWRPATLADRAS